MIPDLVLQKLEFPEILQRLAEYAGTEAGREACLAMHPLEDETAIQHELESGRQALRVYLEEGDLPLNFSQSVHKILAASGIEGNWLSAVDFHRLNQWLQMGKVAWNWVKTRKEKCPLIWEMLEPVQIPAALVSAIDRVISPLGEIRDNASDKLSRVRREIAEASGRLRKDLNRILKQAQSQGWTTEKEITFRNDRLVIPLNADFKGKVPGFVHDVSQSGQTIYIEPQDSLEMNNQLRKLASEEKNEITRILTELTKVLSGHLPILLQLQYVLARLDLLWAKANFGFRIGASYPKFMPESRHLLIVNGRHPVLILRHGIGNVVPNSMELDEKNRILLISGPNAGGKTVMLKLAGLYSLMLQSGIPVPCEDQSRFPFFRKIFVSIGDEQSLGTDLSTYTSHLKQLNEMTGGLDSSSLFLIDEFGSGTDPRMGGAIAEAFLENFLSKNSFGIISTHYGNLKTFAEKNSGIRNAAMQFDPLNLSPTYKLLTGMAGGSYAFEIARKAGVNPEILEHASSKVDSGQMAYEELLLKVESQKAELESFLHENRDLNRDLKTLLEKNKQLKIDLEKNKSKFLSEAKEEARKLVREANRKIENIIREIRESGAEKETTKGLRLQLEEVKKENSILPIPGLENEAAGPDFSDNPEEDPGQGDWVKFRDSGNVGQLIQLQGNRAVVRMGEVRITAKLKNLIKVDPTTKPEIPAGREKRVSVEKMSNIQRELNVMGLRVDQALPLVEKFLDDAVLGALKEVSILHGKGTGALRNSIRDYLRGNQRVISMKDAPIESGGSGWTIVELG